MTRFWIVGAAISLCLLGINTAEARPRRSYDAPAVMVDRHDFRGPMIFMQESRKQRRKYHHRHAKRQSRPPQASAKAPQTKTAAPIQLASLGPDLPPMEIAASLVDKARRFLGSNPTGWRNLWCGRFMAMIAPDLARRVRNPNWARDWLDLPRVAQHVGAIAVLSRGRGGHIGVVTGFDKHGNPIIISGNHGHKVGEGVYSKRRVLAYVGN